MKFENLKLNQKLSSKLLSFALASTIATSVLAGCDNTTSNSNSSSNNILSSTVLERSCVVTFDNGAKDIVVVDSSCYWNKYYHYRSVISGEYYGATGCYDNFHCYNIIDSEPISSYLTYEDLTKALQGGLTDEDIIDIINRIMESDDVNTYTKTK